MIGIIHSGGGGGASSDDVTATSAQVVTGYTAITKDSDDDPKGGTLEIGSILDL